MLSIFFFFFSFLFLRMGGTWSSLDRIISRKLVLASRRAEGYKVAIGRVAFGLYCVLDCYTLPDSWRLSEVCYLIS